MNDGAKEWLAGEDDRTPIVFIRVEPPKPPTDEEIEEVLRERDPWLAARLAGG